MKLPGKGHLNNAGDKVNCFQNFLESNLLITEILKIHSTSQSHFEISSIEIIAAVHCLETIEYPSIGKVFAKLCYNNCPWNIIAAIFKK